MYQLLLVSKMDVKLSVVVMSVCLMMDKVSAGGVIGKKSHKCSASGIAVYEVHLQTFWSRDKFSKQYPLYRPRAQWSRTVGRTHGSDYVMWRQDTLASNGIMQFAETGISSDLDQESQGYKDIFDIFSLPKIDSGLGETATYIFVDNVHPLVSLVSRLIPSPDWFVGVDSVSLCEDADWTIKKWVDLKIWDAGTDKGLTFTSPNWPEVPHKPITQITASHPQHPASSFYYPDVTELPVIARLTFTRKSVSDVSRLQRDWASPKGEKLPQNTELRTHSSEVKKDSESSLRRGELGTSPVGAKLAASSENDPVGKKIAEVPDRERSRSDGKPATQKYSKNKLSKEEKRRRRLERKKRKNAKKSRKNQRKASLKRGTLVDKKVKDVDCQVLEWQPWTACSKTCGYGSRTRTRAVLTEVRGRGVRCPPLVQEETCGSMRSCGWSHFSSDNWGTLSKEK